MKSMAKSKGDLALRQDGELTSARAAGRATRNRFRALVDAAVAEADATGEPHERIRDAYKADPIGTWERIHKLLPPEGEAPANQGGITMNIKDLYLQAVQDANKPRAPLVDITPGTSRVHEDASDW
jgi:hypothetical protein